MKFFAFAAMLGAVTAQEIFPEEQTESVHWVPQNKAALQMQCGRIKVRLTQAYQYARVVAGLTDEQKGVTSIMAANAALNTCSYDNIAYKCAPDQADSFFLKLKFAKQALGTVCRMNTDENLEYAFNSVYWAFEYGARCINPKAYYASLLDVDFKPWAAKSIDRKVQKINATVEEHMKRPQGKAIKKAIEEVANTKAHKSWTKAKSDAVINSAEYKDAKAKIEKTHAHLESAVHEKKNGFHIDNKDLKVIEKEAEQAEAAVKKFIASPRGQDINAHVEKVMKTKAARNLEAAVKAYKKGDGKQLKRKFKALKRFVKKNAKVSDEPADK